MNPDAYLQVFIASIAGGFTGALVMWNRKRSQIAGESRGRRLAVLILGTVASGCALVGLIKAFGGYPLVYAPIVVILTTGWVAVLQSVMRLPVPKTVLRVGTGEFARLAAPWTGVRLFGVCLRRTPLRHLGGRVFLSGVGGDPLAVLPGLYDAEIVHLWAVLVTCPWLVYWAVRGQWWALVCALAVHVPLNIYPILHLRCVTFRIERCVASAGRKQETRRNKCPA